MIISRQKNGFTRCFNSSFSGILFRWALDYSSNAVAKFLETPKVKILMTLSLSSGKQ